MPDWTYRTVLKPLLCALPEGWAHGLVLQVLRRLGGSTAGGRVLEFFGHMRPDPRLRVRRAELDWQSPLGLGSAVDPRGLALGAWRSFGFGFVEVGPVGAEHDCVVEGGACRDGKWIVPDGCRAGVDDLARALAGRGSESPAVWVRLGTSEPGALRGAVGRFRRGAFGFVVQNAEGSSATEMEEAVTAVVEAVGAGADRRRVLVAFESSLDADTLRDRIARVLRLGADGIWLDARARGERGDWEYGNRSLPVILEHVAWVRRVHGPDPWIMTGGAHVPSEVLALRTAGVDFPVLDSGMVVSGPGLPKRIHAALVSQRFRGVPRNAVMRDAPWGRASWFWSAMLGTSMLIGGVMATVIASTRVVLPYDEVFCGVSRDGLATINPRLLGFMAHDRVTLAGTMISVGGLYLGLALNAVRKGAHWAKVTISASALSGFFSFFLFLGFGYFDPFHAFVTAILFQFLLLSLHARLGRREGEEIPDLEETVEWRRGQWGQLGMVLLGVGLTGAGFVISGIGVTEVFVKEDLEYLRTTTAALRSANARLIPLVAHDRASLGGMLMANGLALWLSAQWGFARGRRWLWWTLLLAGTPAFVAAIGVHLAVGYTDPWHLAPACLAAVAFVVALTLSREWLCDVRRDDPPHGRTRVGGRGAEAAG